LSSYVQVMTAYILEKVLFTPYPPQLEKSTANPDEDWNLGVDSSVLLGETKDFHPALQAVLR